MTDKLATKSIRLDGGTQSRAEINNDVVTDYAAEMKSGVKFPAVVVFFDGDNYWCADGFHRVQAALRVNIQKIEAEVRQGTQRDAILYSCGANANHGLRRSNADKRRAVMKLLTDDEWGKWSSSEIARRCAVSHTFIDNLRSSLATVASENYQRSYTDKHGNTSTMQTGSIGKSVRYESNADDDATPDDVTNIVYAPPGTPHGEYNFSEDGDPIIYGDSFYPVNHIGKFVIVLPFPSKDAVWATYRGWQAVQGSAFSFSPLLKKYEYWSADAYETRVEAALATPSITDGIPDAPMNAAVTQDANEIDLNDEPDVDDEDTQKLDLPAAAPEQLPFDDEDPNDPDPFANGYEVTPFGRQPITPKPESKVSAEAGSIIDTATSLRAIADALSNSGKDTPISGWEAGQVGVMQGAKQIYADRQNVDSERMPDEPEMEPPLEPPLTLRAVAISAFTSSETVEWYTPAIYIKSARTVMGDIDLDPASCDEAQATVKARQYFTKETDGLAQKWHGRVWMNPPYGRDEDNTSTVEKWVARVVTAYINREIEQATILVNATPDRTWFDMLWAFPVCFLRKRIKFYGPNNTNGNPTVGNAIVYLGDNVPGFVEEFEQYGPISFSTRMFRRNNIELADVFGELFYEEVVE